jgi:protein gp37
MNETRIAWAEHSWNPVTGCSKVSPGCANCYAERITRSHNADALPWIARHANVNVQMKPERLTALRKVVKPSSIFVNSMSDFFHSEIPDSYRDEIMLAMLAYPQHRYLILTKRDEAMADYLTAKTLDRLQSQTTISLNGQFPDNWWFGVSVESRKFLPRLDRLKAIDVPTKWVSFEPLLESLGEFNLIGIDWCVVGGESGKAFRPMDHRWACAIRDIALRDNCEFFFKQSSGIKPETGKELIEPDGNRARWEYYPIDGKRYQRPATTLMNVRFDEWKQDRFDDVFQSDPETANLIRKAQATGADPGFIYHMIDCYWRTGFVQTAQKCLTAVINRQSG